MKKTTVLCATIITMLGAFSMCANTSDELNTCSIAREYESHQNLGPLDGMYFDVRGVVDNICYGKGNESAYYLIYDDMDAGLTYEAIRVSQETYTIVLDHMEHNKELAGTLTATKEYETVVYVLHIED